MSAPWFSKSIFNVKNPLNVFGNIFTSENCCIGENDIIDIYYALFSKSCPIFVIPDLCLFSKYNNLLWVCLSLNQNLTHFDPPYMKVHNWIDTNRYEKKITLILKEAFGFASSCLLTCVKFKAKWTLKLSLHSFSVSWQWLWLNLGSKDLVSYMWQLYAVMMT